MSDDTDVHTCHSECPCQTGGEPTRDFAPAEGWLPPYLAAMVLHRLYGSDDEQPIPPQTDSQRQSRPNPEAGPDA
jgi:hypothetical protein